MFLEALGYVVQSPLGLALLVGGLGLLAIAALLTISSLPRRHK